MLGPVAHEAHEAHEAGGNTESKHDGQSWTQVSGGVEEKARRGTGKRCGKGKDAEVVPYYLTVCFPGVNLLERSREI